MALEAKTVTTVDTKKDKDSPSKQTTFTVDWTAINEQMLRNGYLAWLIVKRQNHWRNKGIPAAEVCVAKDHAPGQRAPAMTLEQQLAALSPEERKALFAKHGIK